MVAISQETTTKLQERAEYLAKVIGNAGIGAEEVWSNCYLLAYQCLHLEEQTEAIRSLTTAVAAMFSERKEVEHGHK